MSLSWRTRPGRPTTVAVTSGITSRARRMNAHTSSYADSPYFDWHSRAYVAASGASDRVNLGSIQTLPITTAAGLCIAIPASLFHSYFTDQVDRFVVEMDRNKIDTVKEELKKSGISVVRAGEDRLIESVSVVLVGHVLDSDLGDTIDRIDTTGYAEVMDLSLSMTGINEPSSAYLKIRATGKAEIQKALSILREVGKEKQLLVIEPIEMEAI